MKRIPKPFVAVVALAVAMLIPATAVARSDGPAVHLSPHCESGAYYGDPTDGPMYGVWVWVTGLPPHATFTGELRFPSGPIIPDPMHAYDTGNWGPFGMAESTPLPWVTATMWYDGGEYTTRIEHPCEGSNVDVGPPWPLDQLGPPPDPSLPADLNLSAPPAQKTSRKHLAAKRQCRHRGWKRYGFKNRKRCVAYVKHAHRS